MRSSRLHRRLGLRKVYALGCFVYATGFFLWGVVANRTIVSLLAVFEGAGFSLLFTVDPRGRQAAPVLAVLERQLARRDGRFGIGPILGAGIGGIVFDELGSLTLFVGSAVLAAAGGVAALLVLRTPALDTPLAEVPAVAERCRPSRAGSAAALTCVLCSGVPRMTWTAPDAPAGGRERCPRRSQRRRRTRATGRTAAGHPVRGQDEGDRRVGRREGGTGGREGQGGCRVGGREGRSRGREGRRQGQGVAGTVSEKAGPAVEKAKDSAGELVGKVKGAIGNKGDADEK